MPAILFDLNQIAGMARSHKVIYRLRSHDLSYYNRHIFFCVNDRGCDAERPSCAQCGGQEMRDYAKAKIKGMGLSGEGNVRVNQAGCLDRCEEGPACVVYPEGTWYTFIDESDVDEIIESHLVNGKIVDRLLI